MNAATSIFPTTLPENPTRMVPEMEVFNVKFDGKKFRKLFNTLEERGRFVSNYSDSEDDLPISSLKKEQRDKKMKVKKEEMDEERELGPGEIRLKKKKKRGEWLCSYCGKKFCKSFSLEQHLSKHGIFELRTCDLCGHQTKTRGRMFAHMADRHLPKPYSCDQCGKGFAFMSYLKQHAQVHEEGRNHKCHHCEASFRLAAGLRNHVRLIHQKSNCHCTECGKYYTNYSGLYSHRKTGHDGPNEKGQFVCKFCSKVNHSYSAMYMHLRTVHSVGPAMQKRAYEKVTCEKCNNTYSQKGYLSKHKCVPKPPRDPNKKRRRRNKKKRDNMLAIDGEGVGDVAQHVQVETLNYEHLQEMHHSMQSIQSVVSPQLHDYTYYKLEQEQGHY